MAIYVVELKFLDESNRWGIFHSTSGTMYSPTFNREEELAAYMFMRYCEQLARFEVISEREQMLVATEIGCFLDEVAPHISKRRNGRKLAQAWSDRLVDTSDGTWCAHCHERIVQVDEIWMHDETQAQLCAGQTTPATPQRNEYEEDSLVEDFLGTRHDKTDFVMDEFRAWQQAHRPAVVTK